MHLCDAVGSADLSAFDNALFNKFISRLWADTQCFAHFVHRHNVGILFQNGVIDFFEVIHNHTYRFCVTLNTVPLEKPQREQVQAVFLLSIEKAPALDNKSLQVRHRPISIVLLIGSIKPRLIARAFGCQGTTHSPLCKRKTGKGLSVALHLFPHLKAKL